MKYIDMELPDEEQSGTYEIEGDKLITRSKAKINTSRISIVKDDLMIDDGGGEVFRYKRIQY
jgi:hypothetical protein